MKLHVGGPALVVVCLTSLFGAADGASAVMTFLPENHKFPYHLIGSWTSPSMLETTFAKKVSSSGGSISALVSSKTELSVVITLTKTEGEGGKCNTAGSPEGVLLIKMLGYVGWVNIPVKPGVLLLMPAGFEFTCGESIDKVRGGLAGLITAPAEKVASEELLLLFEEEKGLQRERQFLLPEDMPMTANLEASIRGGSFETAGEQLGPLRLLALAGSGAFLLT